MALRGERVHWRETRYLERYVRKHLAAAWPLNGSHLEWSGCQVVSVACLWRAEVGVVAAAAGAGVAIAESIVLCISHVDQLYAVPKC